MHAFAGMLLVADWGLCAILIPRELVRDNAKVMVREPALPRVCEQVMPEIRGKTGPTGIKVTRRNLARAYVGWQRF
jgi:hypothetical protein